MPVKLRGTILTMAQRSKRAPSKVRDALQGDVREVVDTGRSAWPVDSGRSAAGLDDEVRGPTAVAAVGRAPYTTAIVSRGRRPWFDLIVLPLERMIRSELGADIGTAIDRALRVR